MLPVIITITFIAIAILCIGFFEINFPFLSLPANAYRKYKSVRKASKHIRKIQHKKLWHDQMHKGFIELSA